MESNFAIFIMVYGRPDKNWTYALLRNSGYTGKIYLVADNTDLTLGEYQRIYGDELIIFDKALASTKYDSGDNTGDLRSTMFAANTIFELAEQRGIEYFSIMCDDYVEFGFRYLNADRTKLLYKPVTDLDGVLELYLDFYKKSNFTTIAFAQGGDFIGGAGNDYIANLKMKRKAMNSFICSTHRKFQFLGRLNEDATTYVNLGQKGHLFGTIPVVSIKQKATQEQAKGLTEVYLDNGTFIKSFFSVMYNPNSVKVAMMGDKHYRIHHIVDWDATAPKIINEKYSKTTK